MRRRFHRYAVCLLVLGLVSGLWALPAYGYEFTQPLRKGDKGRPVRALQVRLAGWFPGELHETFNVDGHFGRQTVRTVKAFQKEYGLVESGVARRSLFAILHRLQDNDGSTSHFDFSEFEQNFNSNCGARANAYSGTLGGGLVSPRRTKMYVKRLMWRLEAVRRKAGGKPIGINSGFRSVAYNDCIGGARASQHMYGTAVDQRQANVSNRWQRKLARRSQFHGIGCYSSQTHNHLDLRIDNRDLPTQQGWWWPDRDDSGRDLDESGAPCWGETTTSSKTTTLAVGAGHSISTSLVPSATEVERFEAAGEGVLTEGAD